MLTRKEIKAIAEKLKWEVKETEVAIKEFCNSGTIVDCDQFLRMCAEAKNSEHRRSLLNDYLLAELTRHYPYSEDFNISPKLKSKLVKTIGNWLRKPDPCFAVWAVFNISEIKGNDFSYADAESGSRKSFFKLNPWDKRVYQTTSFLMYPEPKFEQFELCDGFLDYLIWKLQEEGSALMTLLLDIVKEVGFNAFNIRSLRALASWYSENPVFKEWEIELAEALNPSITNRQLATERKYWLFYALAEILIREKFAPNPTKVFMRVAKVFDTKDGSVRREYYRKKKVAEAENLSLDDIMEKYSLQKVANSYLEKLKK